MDICELCMKFVNSFFNFFIFLWLRVILFSIVIFGLNSVIELLFLFILLINKLGDFEIEFENGVIFWMKFFMMVLFIMVGERLDVCKIYLIILVVVDFLLVLLIVMFFLVVLKSLVSSFVFVILGRFSLFVVWILGMLFLIVVDVIRICFVWVKLLLFWGNKFMFSFCRYLNLLDVCFWLSVLLELVMVWFWDCKRMVKGSILLLVIL